MSILDCKEQFYKFNETRRAYKNNKKELLVKFIETRSEEVKKELEQLKENFYNEFKTFGEIASNYSPKELFEYFDEDYIFWLCFSLEDFFQESKEELLKDGIMKTLEWKPNKQ